MSIWEKLIIGAIIGIAITSVIARCSASIDCQELGGTLVQAGGSTVCARLEVLK